MSTVRLYLCVSKTTLESQVLSINYIWHAEGKRGWNVWWKPTYCAFSCSFYSHHLFPAVVVLVWWLGVKFACVCKRKLSITNDSSSTERRRRTGLNRKKPQISLHEQMTRWKRFLMGWFKGFWEWKEYFYHFVCH